MAGAKAAPKPAPPEVAWHEARLIPTTGIGGQDEQEQRATSSLLAVMKAVPQFGRAILGHLGAPAGRVTTFTEVRFPDGEDRTAIPDGAIVIERGRTRWTCLVEVKTGAADLRSDQLEKYLDIARVHGFDALLSISNQITASPSELPLALDSRKIRKLTVRHLSWWQVMTEARVQHEHRHIADTDQAWILGELIAYLDHEHAGTGGFSDMGEAWVAVRDGARQNALRGTTKGVRDVAARWEQFVQYVALGLCQDLGRSVEVAWPKQLAPAARLDASVRALVEQGTLSASIRVPDAAGAIDLSADLRTRLLATSVELTAPRDGRPQTRINWVLKQLREAPEPLRIEVRYPNAKETVSATLREAREKPSRLLYGPDPHRQPRSIRLALSRDIGMKRGKSAGSFVAESKRQVLDFYGTILQGLKPWSPSAPKLPGGDAKATTEASPNPPDFSGEAREFGEATEPAD